MYSKILFVFFIVDIIFLVNGSHFRGGTITWRPISNVPSGGTVQIQITQRYSWNRNVIPCDGTTIAGLGLIGDYSSVTCVTGSCPVSFGLTSDTYCTDYSVDSIVSSGEKSNVVTINVGTSFSVGYISGAWFGNLVVGANGAWNIVNLISTVIRPDNYINTSPVATTLPVIYKQVNIQHVHVVQMADFDSNDVLKCRWSIGSTSNINGYNECGSVCSGVPGAALYTNNCTIVFTLTVAASYAAVALQIEDYYSVSSSSPMSSVPLQFLFYGYVAPSGCSTPSTIIGVRPNRACIGVDIGASIVEYVIAQVGCSGKTITDFTTTSPVGLTKSAIQNPSTGVYQIILSWVPTASQYGPQGFCAAAVDNTNVQSDQWCITFLVGFTSPSIIRPQVVQGSASPIGTIYRNHTVFSIQATNVVNRPTRNGTYIRFIDAATNTVVQAFDCGWQSEVAYTGYTVVIRFPTAPWVAGHQYYVTFDSGVASGTEFCGPESAPITDPTFWNFDIWNPGLSSTTANTTTTTLTTPLVTTRIASTTTVLANLTTTGIAVTTTSTRTTTTTTSTTSTTSTTTSTETTTTTSGATTIINVLYPSDWERACSQPVALTNGLLVLGLLPIKILVTYVSFAKFSKMFDPRIQRATARYFEHLRKL